MSEIIATDGNVFFTLKEFNDIKILDIRKYYKDKESKELKPSQKGIAVTSRRYETIKKIFSQYDEKITNWLDSDPISQTIKQRQQIVQKHLYSYTPATSNSEKWKSPDFFDSNSEGGINKITYNEGHAFYENFSSILNELERYNPEKAKDFVYLVNALISSFVQARALLDDKHGSDELIDVLVYNWGIILANALKRD